MFDLDRFIADCQDALATGGSTKAMRPVVERAVSEPGVLMDALGEPRAAGINLLYRSPSLTILNLIWGPGMTIMPHNHHMWAVIGIYTGREDNIFWRQLPSDARWPIEAAGARSMMAGDVCALGADIIHSVNNPLKRLTGALHVYGGDFVSQSREEWDPETLCEQPYDMGRARRLFEDSNRMLQAA
jgi:predicted metal-dependent enzyme (double-stranded beta helix superfamily)